MTDTLDYEVGFDGQKAFKGLETLRGLLNTTKVAALQNTAAMEGGFRRLNNTEVKIKGLDTIVADMERTRAKTESAMRQIQSNFDALPAPVTKSQMAIAGFAGGLGAMAFSKAIAGLRDLIGSFTDFSDKASSIQAKLTLATAKFGDFAQAQQDVVAIANKSRADLGAVTDLYSTMARNATTLGLSQKQVATATQTVGMALKIGGQGAAQSAAAILQLSQAMGSGKLAGDEFASLAENAPRLMDLFAEAIGKPRGELKKLASDGKITSAVIAKALTDPKLVAGIEKEFGKIPVTFGDIKTAAGNTFTQITAAFAKGFGISDSLAVILAKVQSWGASLQPTFEAIGKAMREVFDELAPVLTSLKEVGSQALGFLVTNMTALIGVAKAAAAAFLVFKVAAGAQWISGTVGQIIALERALGASGAASAIFSAGMKVAQRAVNGLTASLLANPFTALAVALTATVTLLYQFRDSIKIGGGSIASLGDLGSAAFETMTEAVSSAYNTVSKLASDIGGWFTETFSGLGQMAEDTFGSIGEWFNDTFSWITDIAGTFFDGIDFSLLGMLRLVARVLDTMIGHWRGTFNLMVAYWSGLPKALSTIFVNAFNGATAIVEGFINKTIQGVNRVLAFANSLGAAFGQLENVSLGRLSGGGAVTLGQEMGKAYASGFTRPVETALNGVVKRADAIAAKRKAAADAQKKKDEAEQKKATASTPKPSSTSGGDSKAKKATDDAAKAEKKYADAITDLNNRIKDLALTQEQKALADELERAGLGRDITQINAKANAIRDLFKKLQEAEKARKVSDLLKDFNEKVRELGYSQEQLAQVEARRRAGLNTDLSYTDELTKKVDAQASAYYRLAKAKENAQAIKDIEKDQEQRKQEVQFDELARTNPDKAEDERRLAQIEQERAANVKKLELMEGITAEKRAELIANENNLAKLREQGVEMDRQAQYASALTNFLTDMWENPKQAFKSFIKDVLAGLLEAIAKAVILGEKLGGGGGIGGLLTSVIGGAIGIGGGRASGGSVAAGDVRWVGENGPELMKFGAAGTIINNRTAKRAIGTDGGGGITFGGTTIVIQGGATNDNLAQLKAQQDAFERRLVATIRKETR